MCDWRHIGALLQIVTVLPPEILRTHRADCPLDGESWRLRDE
jgi:hypothetical protein